MGKMNNGILDHFSGTIDKVVGSNWRGVSNMRAKSKKRTGVLSDAQLEQQAKFAVAGKFAQSMNDLLTLGFKGQAIKMTGTRRYLLLIALKKMKQRMHSVLPAMQEHEHWICMNSQAGCIPGSVSCRPTANCWPTVFTAVK